MCDLLQLSGDLGNNKRDQLGHGFMVHPLLTNAAIVQFDSARFPTEIRNFFREQQIRLKPPAVAGGVATSTWSTPLVNPELDLRVFDLQRLGRTGSPKPSYRAGRSVLATSASSYDFGADRASTLWSISTGNSRRMKTAASSLDREQSGSRLSVSRSRMSIGASTRGTSAAPAELWHITIEYLRQHGRRPAMK